MALRSVENVGAKGISFYTPAQDPPAGTVEGQDQNTPKLFTPLTVRGLTFPNRIWVSPMGMCSSKDGFQTRWHEAHYGSIVSRGAVAVSENGRTCPEDGGIYKDEHIPGLRRHVELAHSQGALISIQLHHGGRKAGGLASWLGYGVASPEHGGWAHLPGAEKGIVGPSAIPFSEHSTNRVVPHALSVSEIETVKQDFVDAARRAVEAGFDFVELHYAHGYLVSSFLAPTANQRTDRYGGSFANRTRLAVEIATAVRHILPETMPLFVRLSATDWLPVGKDNKSSSDSKEDESTWTVEQSAQLALLLADVGVDVIDVSSGGIDSRQKPHVGPAYQTFLAKHIKRVVGDRVLVSAVGKIETAVLAEEILVGGTEKKYNGEDDVPLDLIAVGRPFLKNPGLVWQWADELGVPVRQANQYRWGFLGRGIQTES